MSFSYEAAPGSEFTTALLWLLSKKVRGRPLPTSSPAMVLSGWRLQAKFNLQATWQRWRPLCYCTAGSRHLAPSGIVPGGIAIDCAVVLRCGGNGAGHNGVFKNSCRVSYAKSLDQIVILLFFGQSCTLLCHRYGMKASRSLWDWPLLKKTQNKRSLL
jgi:hypothetical protein